MHRPRYATGFLLAPIVFAFVFGALACTNQAPEKTLLDRFFSASKYRDNVTLGGIAMVAVEGVVENFSVVSVGEEQSEPLHLKELSARHQQAVKADTEYGKQMNAYHDSHADEITRVLEAEAKNRTLAGKDAAIQTEWNRWRDGQRVSSKKVSEAKEKMAGERTMAHMSIHQGLAREAIGDWIDVTGYDGTIVSKDYTISANVITPSNQHVTKTLVVTLQRVVLHDPDGHVALFPGRNEKGDISGKWIITQIKDATAGATS
jgi:hypothetical protein